MSRNRWVQFGILVSVGLLLGILAFRGQDFRAIWDKISQAKWGWVLISMLLTLLGHLSRARRWQLLIRSTGHEVSLLASFVAMMTGYLSNLGIPRIGELGRCASLTRLSGAPIMALGGTVVAERVVDLLTFGLLVVITFVTAGERLLTFWAAQIAGPLAQLGSWKLAVVAGVGLLGLAALAALVFGRRGSAPWLQRLRAWAQELWAGMWSAVRVRRPLEFGLHTVLIWLSYYTAPMCSLLALGIGGDNLLQISFLAFVFGSLARTLPLPAGSMGAYHYLIAQLFVAMGYSELEGLSLATLNHGVQTLFYLVFGLLGLLGFLVLERRRYRDVIASGNAEG